ncbi:cyanophycin synthetase [Clostridium fallax]|uniref:Cyanophycin synthetase n=1 Tax=Clostridium fallax TaxID=1533 RepID=A0A1M4WI56_9CLOT|nr:cyanophycin synthetase [Clostridium fallax]SHE80867.1 cyanophycin synthetase [Clostridium fallax]SQB05719.1 cyanophycin synthetase [Clostridium fallax]
MRLLNEKIFEGRNIYSHKKVIRIDIDLEGYSDIPTKDIPNFNYNILKIVPELKKHRCGIDEEGGFVKRLNEGTYLAHVCEHIIIGLQNSLDIDVVYGKAREIQGDIYYIIFQYEYERLGIACANLAIDIINSLISNIPINIEDRISILKKIKNEEILGPSTRAICEAAKKRNLPVLKLGDSGMYQIGYGKMGRVFGATIGYETKCIGADIACDKVLTKSLLKCQCIPVAEGGKVYSSINLLNIAEKIGYPVVLKPQFGSKGKGVILNIKNQKELLKAYNKALKEYKDIMIEKYFIGEDYRVLVVNYEVVAVSKRIPPFIIGDGEKTIKELIKELNSDDKRGENHEKPLTKVKIDEELLKILEQQELNIFSVPLKGEKIKLRYNANLSTGGIAEDYTDVISDENKEICIRAAKTIGLDICGIDISTNDISKSLKENGIIVEVNAAPGIRMHQYPSKGEKRDVALSIVDMMYDNNPYNIPVISVTGTNGKTTTTRLINFVLSKKGYKVGMTSTSGISIDNKYIDYGDDTGADSAKTILLNKDVDIAVLETARGGMIKKGLAYDLADVGIITNITEDHLGIDEIENIEDLAFVKSLVLEAVKKDGYAVINGDDPYSLSILDRVKSKKIFFSQNKNNKFLRENIESGNPGVYIDGEAIYVENNKKIYKICNINDVKISLKGALTYNLYNAMAACAALVALNVDYCLIAKGLKEFTCDEKDNPGRFNQYYINGINIILDYGHNYEGYRAVLDGVKKLNHNNLIGVIGVPGDRKDNFIKSIGTLSGDYFDYVYIKEDREKRGRKCGEVARLLELGLCKKISKSKYKIILDELEALDYAIKKASEGDTIIVFFEDFKPLSKYLKNLEALNLIKDKNIESL